jgi:hypothetical protein
MLKWQEHFVKHYNFAFDGWDKPGVFVCGGAARGYALNEEFGDIDIFFDSPQTFVDFYQHILSKGVEYIIQNDEDVVLTLRNGKQYYQLYKKSFFKSWEEVVDDFDFTNCQFAVDHRRLSYWTTAGYKDAVNKELRAHKLKYPVVALRRIEKFLAAGYEPCDGFWEDTIQRLKAIEDTHANVRTSP